MLTKTKIALSVALVVGSALSASAATKPQADAQGSAVYTMIPGYNKDGAVVATRNPDHLGQPHSTGDQIPLR
jgi:hypothetical protein